MTDTNNTDRAALLPCPLCGDPMKKDNAGTFGHTDSNAKCLLARQAWALMPSYVDAWNTRSPLPATQEDAERSVVGEDTREARIQKYLVDQARSRERLMTFPPAVSERLRRWQEGQSEWFSNTVLEIVAEFITFDDALSTPQRQEYDGEAVRASIWQRDDEWVLEISGTINDTNFVSRHTEPLSTPKEAVAGLPSLYAALAHPAQARDEMRAPAVDETDGDAK